MVCSALGKNLWHRWKTIPGDVCPAPVIIPAQASQGSTEFVGCCQILSPSCVLSVPRLGILLGMGLRELRSHIAAPQLLCILPPAKNQCSSSISSNSCSPSLLQMLLLSQCKPNMFKCSLFFWLCFIFVPSFCF